AEGARIPAVLTLPEDGSARWLVVIIPGSMFSDVDGNYPDAHMKPHMYADLARQLAQRGHAVLRYAKVSEQTGAVIVDKEQAEAHPIFVRQRYIAAAACRKLRELVPEGSRLAIAGHSEGSVHGLVISQWAEEEVRPDAVISLSGPAERYFNLFLQWADAEQKDGYVSLGPVKIAVERYKKVFECIRNGEEWPEEVRNDPGIAGAFGQMDKAGRQYMRDYDAIDPCQEIRKVPCPVLIVQGGMDQSAVLSNNAEKLFAARQEVDPERSRLAFFPELQHFYKRATPELSATESFALDGETDERVAEVISEWLEEIDSEDSTYQSQGASGKA
ncbi:MAG: hypothetical protein J2P36_37360, partial [Ktedonobacteraceae bacterium]|nr:hypothetical protein [Ktedonobacteraceae bacterium]